MVSDQEKYSKYLYIQYINELIQSGKTEGIITYLNNIEQWGTDDIEIIKLETVMLLLDNKLLEIGKRIYQKVNLNSGICKSDEKIMSLKSYIDSIIREK